jgi:hypothetical protein
MKALKSHLFLLDAKNQFTPGTRGQIGDVGPRGFPSFSPPFDDMKDPVSEKTGHNQRRVALRGGNELEGFRPEVEVPVPPPGTEVAPGTELPDESGRKVIHRTHEPGRLQADGV